MPDEPTWSKTEKAIARKAYDAAYQRECAAILAKLREMAAAAHETNDVWRIQELPTKRRRDVDEKYDYRYSQLIYVFGRLLAEGWLDLADIAELREDKLVAIKGLANLFSGR